MSAMPASAAVPTVEPILEVRNVSRYFGSVIALKDVSMSVYPGEVMCLLGDNGAGKSTLIKILSGVHKPSEGEYLVEGLRFNMSGWWVLSLDVDGSMGRDTVTFNLDL